MKKNKPSGDFFSELFALAGDDKFYEARWRKRFSHLVDFECFRGLFLNSTGTRALWIHCPNRMTCEHSCPLEVVFDPPTPYAVCVEEKLAPQALSFRDIEVVEFNFIAFHQRLAGALPLDPAVEQTSNALSWQLGTLRYGRGARRRVFITYVAPRELATEIIRLSVGDVIPMVVFTPCHVTLRDEDNLILSSVEVVRLAVNEIIAVDWHCRFMLTPELPRQIQKLFDDAVKLSEIGTGMPMPVGITWPDIRLRFLDAHTLSCRINQATLTLTFHDLKMVNRKNGKPDKNWLYLMQFAVSSGRLRVEWQNTSRALREQQRKRRLSRVLQAFFHIDDDPIVFERETYSYVCRFRIKPETENSRYRVPQS